MLLPSSILLQILANRKYVTDFEHLIGISRIWEDWVVKPETAVFILSGIHEENLCH